MGQDDVGRQRDQFRRVSANVVGFASGPARVDAHVAPDDPARLRESLLERPDPGLKVRIVRGGVQEHADAPHFFALLRACCERPRRSRAAEQRDERAALHSITSSARCCKNKGTSTPMALAVWRLITSSNFVGCSTGRSAGFVPCKILCTNAALRRYICGTSAP